ncbi:MAG: AAA family ATPase, partial [Candidatus Sericytochromatia bacterium]
MNPRQIPVPICLWRDAGGLVGGCLAERPEIAAVGDNPKEVHGQLQAWIDWYYDEYPWATEPDFFEPELKQFAVEVYPEYRIKEKIYPLAEVMVLAVPCLIGRNGAGQSLVSLPLQKQLFHCYEPEAVKKLVAHYVQQELRGNTPAQLSRQLAPPEIWTGKLSCKSRGERPESAEELPEVLVSVAEPIGDRAARRQFGRAWEREALVRQLCQWLTDEQSNILLVGEAGVGKSTLLAEAVREVERNRTDTEARTKKLPRYWLTSAGRLIAGMQYLGQWQQRCEELVSALAGIKGVLCAESLMGLVRTGGSGPIDSLAAFFQPFLQYGELRMIAEASPAELDACRRLMPGLADQFRILSVPPLERAAALKVMERLQRQQQQEGGPEIEKGTLEQVWHLFRRFAPYSPFPGQPVRFLQQLFEKTRPPAKLSPLDAVRLFSERTGLPERLLRDDQPLGYAQVLSNLQAKVLGQPAACELAARILTLFKAGLNDPARPLGVLLFCGP